MGVSIMYEPIKPGAFLSGGNHFKETLEKAFGNMPFTIGNDNLRELRFAQKIDGNSYHMYQEIIEAIERHETIRIYAEY